MQLVGVTVWFGDDPHFQVYAGLWVFLLATILQVACRPYADERIDFLETLSLTAMLVSLLLGVALALDGLSAAAADGIRLLVALVNLFVLFVFVRHILFDARGATGAKDRSSLATIANPMMSRGEGATGRAARSARGGWIRTRAGHGFHNSEELRPSEDTTAVASPVQPAVDQTIKTRNEPSRSRV